VTRGALALALVVGLSVAAPAVALERVRGVVHVHSDLTTGDFSLEGLVGLAEAQGIGALLLSENYLLRVSYGLPPFRALTRVERRERSVGDAPARYLERVAEVRRRLPHVLLVPGVEVMPHYHWTGSPLALDLTAHNLQKNLLVFGVTDPAALRTLPAPGHAPAGHYTIQSVPMRCRCCCSSPASSCSCAGARYAGGSVAAPSSSCGVGRGVGAVCCARSAWPPSCVAGRSRPTCSRRRPIPASRPTRRSSIASSNSAA
jgi:hypothetical protein